MPGIVVGVDGSPHSLNALDWALGQAEVRRMPLTALAVAPVAIGLFGIAPLHYPADEEDRKKVEQATKDFVDQACSRRGSTPADVTVRAISGVPADELVKASFGADLVVVGARGAGGFARLRLGSVSAELAHHSAAPLVIVPGERDTGD
jgi:nucleotide-binding universal stress UspA family protein